MSDSFLSKPWHGIQETKASVSSFPSVSLTLTPQHSLSLDRPALLSHQVVQRARSRRCAVQASST
eukprot:3029852-Rhodomonas_salina.1